MKRPFHTREKPCKCNECEKAFNYYKSIIQYEKTRERTLWVIKMEDLNARTSFPDIRQPHASELLGVYIETADYQAYPDLQSQNLSIKPKSLSFPKPAQVICMCTEMCTYTFRWKGVNMTTDGKLSKLLAGNRKFRMELCPSDYHVIANNHPNLSSCYPYNTFLEMIRYWKICSPPKKADVYINNGKVEKPFL